MTNTLTTVVFDLGNVLIEWDRRNLFGKLIDDPDELERFLDGVFTMDDNARLDKGTPLREVADGAIERNPDMADLISVIVDRWEEMLGPVIQGTVDILDELPAGVRLRRRPSQQHRRLDVTRLRRAPVRNPRTTPRTTHLPPTALTSRCRNPSAWGPPRCSAAGRRPCPARTDV